MKRIELINSLCIIDLKTILLERKECKVTVKIIFCMKLLNQFRVIKET